MRSNKLIGLDLRADSPREALDAIIEAENLGIPAVWVTSGGGSSDALSLFAAAASNTDEILLGTSIARTWSRHPISMAEQAFTVSSFAPGRLRLGIGSGHKASMESTYGVDFHYPLGHVREYVAIIKELLTKGETSYSGRYYSANTSMGGTAPGIPVMISALRPGAYRTAGEIADGAISWVCPHFYAITTALDSLNEGARTSGRDTPPLILQAAVCITNNLESARAAVRDQLGIYPSIDFYSRMFEQSGFEITQRTGWTNEMIDSILITGTEEEAASQLDKLFASGVSEILASVVGDADRADSSDRTRRFIADYCSQ